MRRQEKPGMKMSELKISKFIAAFDKYFWLRMFVFLGLLLSVWWMRFPFIFRKMYAEDGSLFLVDALRFKFPTDLIEPAAGYSTLIMRLGGRFVSIFPLENAAIMGGLFTAICLSALAAGLFQYNNFNSQNFLSRLTLSLSFLFLPLTSFSAVGNIANLYVYFMTASAVFLYYHEKTLGETFYKSFMLLVAALSLPLTIFLLPILLHRIYLDKKANEYLKILRSDVVFVTGLVSQFVFIAITSFGERAPNAPQSIFKVVYLYFERGIGISIIPKWGFISNTNGVVKYENSIEILQSLQLRLIVVLVILALFAFIFYRSISKISWGMRSQICLIMALGFMYSILVGLFFNSEPRYMIFTSFLTCWAILLLLDSQGNSNLRFISTSYIIVVLVFGLTASIHRSQGPEWKSEVSKARQICIESENLEKVEIRTLPVDRIWNAKISCKNLR
jgi:hypothetical protein